MQCTPVAKAALNSFLLTAWCAASTLLEVSKAVHSRTFCCVALSRDSCVEMHNEQTSCARKNIAACVQAFGFVMV